LQLSSTTIHQHRLSVTKPEATQFLHFSWPRYWFSLPTTLSTPLGSERVLNADMGPQQLPRTQRRADRVSSTGPPRLPSRRSRCARTPSLYSRVMAATSHPPAESHAGARNEVCSRFPTRKSTRIRPWATTAQGLEPAWINRDSTHPPPSSLLNPRQKQVPRTLTMREQGLAQAGNLNLPPSQTGNPLHTPHACALPARSGRADARV
jgi:hypothetical protein